MREPIGIMGAGWVGLVTAACYADLGHEVIIRDIEAMRIADETGQGGAEVRDHVEQARNDP